MTNRTVAPFDFGPTIARRNAIAAAVATCAVLFALPAAAVDGEILIDQAKVNAGGITPGDDPGFPATLNKPGRYKLSGNLRVPAGKDGLLVVADDVTIDFNGFTISGNPPNQALTAVDARGVNRPRVMNGTITGFRHFGVNNDNGAFAVVENMRILFMGGQIDLGYGVNGNRAQVRNNTIAYCNLAVWCVECLIEQNIISGSQYNGIDASGGLVLENVIASNGSEGLASVGAAVGYGNNLLFENNGGGGQVYPPAIQLHANFCEPACP
jgi:hypothetical protein